MSDPKSQKKLISLLKLWDRRERDNEKKKVKRITESLFAATGVYKRGDYATVGKKVPTRRRIQKSKEEVTLETVVNDLNYVVPQNPSAALPIVFPQPSDHVNNVIASVEAMDREDAIREMAEEFTDDRDKNGDSQTRKLQLSKEWTESTQSLVEALLRAKGFRAKYCMQCSIDLPGFFIQCACCATCCILCPECDLKIHFMNPLHERVLNHHDLQYLPRILLPREVVDDKGSVYERGVH